MNPITAIKLAGFAEAAKTVAGGVGQVFRTSGNIGAAIGHELGSAGVGKAVGYAAPVLAANYAANQFAPTRRAKAWLGQQIGAGGNVVGSALIPGDFGTRPGDIRGGY